MTPEQRIARLEAIINALVGSDRYTLQKDIQLFNGRNLQVGKGVGTKIGTEATQKLGFFGVTPVVQPVRPTDAASIITTGTTLGLWA